MNFLSGFTYIDFIVIAIFIAFVIYGICRGFVKQLMGIVGTLGSFLLAYLFCRQVANLIVANTEFEFVISQWIKGFIDSVWDTEKVISELPAFIEAQSWPTFLEEEVIAAVQSLGTSTVNFAQVAADTISFYILVAISFIAILFIAKIIIFIVEKVLSTIIKLAPIKFVDRFLGAAVAFLKCAVFISLLLYVINIFPIEPLKNLNATLLNSPILNYLMENNLFVWIVHLFFK